MKKPIIYLIIFLILYIGNIYFFTEKYSFDIFTAGHKSALASPKMTDKAFEPLPLKTGKEGDLLHTTTPPQPEEVLPGSIPIAPADGIGIPPIHDQAEDDDEALSTIPTIPQNITIPGATQAQDKALQNTIDTTATQLNNAALIPQNNTPLPQQPSSYPQQEAQAKAALANAQKSAGQNIGGDITAAQASQIAAAINNTPPQPREALTEAQALANSAPTTQDALKLADNIDSPSLTQAETRLVENGLVNVETLPIKVFLDIRYATANNFAGERLYDSPKCYLRKPVADALVKAADLALKQETPFYFCIYDCYRPEQVQKVMWAKSNKSQFLADPHMGSNHSRATAIDLGPCDSFGYSLPMPTDFDEFSPNAAAYSTSPDIAPVAIKNRTMLQKVMKEAGFTTIRKEWWHFDYKNAKTYSLLNIPLI